MEHRSNGAALMDVQTKHGVEESALGMGLIELRVEIKSSHLQL